MPELKLVVTIGVNTHRIDQKTRELSYRLLVALVLGLLLSVFASVFVGDRLAKPFRQIAKTINEINVGNFAARVNYEEDDEIGHLSQRINTLAEKIQKSDYLGNLWSNEAELEQETGGKSSDK
jgi:signal transduction histidine kinase